MVNLCFNFTKSYTFVLKALIFTQTVKYLS